MTATDRNKIITYYSQGIEKDRLDSDAFKLEGIRTKEIIERYLENGPVQILDVGGGTGYYAFWLAQKGHLVTLIDFSPENIDLARTYAQTFSQALQGIMTGEATHLDVPDEQFDLVLLLGPLYHLTDKQERIAALSEAKRVLKPNGILLAAVISRYASLIDGFTKNLFTDDQFFNQMINCLETGIHLNETDNPDYFTTAYFHKSFEIAEEIKRSGLTFEKLIPVESFGCLVSNFSEKEKDPAYLDKLLSTIRKVEGNEELMAISPHLVAVARKNQF